MDGYRNLNYIKEGSFGKVYRAQKRYTGETVALKFIAKQGRTEKDINNFRQEIAIMLRLSHRNIIKCLDWFETEAEFCVVMEYAHGELFDILEDDGSLPEESIRTISRQLIDALYYLHSNRVIHRDMKPQNVLIGDDGLVKLCDFGFARFLKSDALLLTSIKGTPLYMAPELMKETPYNHQADLWSLGVILFELYTGAPPFYTKSIYSLVHLVLQQEVKFPEGITPAFRSFLEGLLQKDPKRRLDWPGLLNHSFIAMPDNAPNTLGVGGDLVAEESVDDGMSVNIKDKEAAIAREKKEHVKDAVNSIENEARGRTPFGRPVEDSPHSAPSSPPAKKTSNRERDAEDSEHDNSLSPRNRGGRDRMPPLSPQEGSMSSPHRHTSPAIRGTSPERGKRDNVEGSPPADGSRKTKGAARVPLVPLGKLVAQQQDNQNHGDAGSTSDSQSDRASPVPGQVPTPNVTPRSRGNDRDLVRLNTPNRFKSKQADALLTPSTLHSATGAIPFGTNPQDETLASAVRSADMIVALGRLLSESLSTTSLPGNDVQLTPKNNPSVVLKNLARPESIGASPADFVSAWCACCRHLTSSVAINDHASWSMIVGVCNDLARTVKRGPLLNCIVLSSALVVLDMFHTAMISTSEIVKYIDQSSPDSSDIMSMIIQCAIVLRCTRLRGTDIDGTLPGVLNILLKKAPALNALLKVEPVFIRTSVLDDLAFILSRVTETALQPDMLISVSKMLSPLLKACQKSPSEPTFTSRGIVYLMAGSLGVGCLGDLNALVEMLGRLRLDLPEPCLVWCLYVLYVSLAGFRTTGASDQDMDLTPVDAVDIDRTIRLIRLIIPRYPMLFDVIGRGSYSACIRSMDGVLIRHTRYDDPNDVYWKSNKNHVKILSYLVGSILSGSNSTALVEVASEVGVAMTMVFQMDLLLGILDTVVMATETFDRVLAVSNDSPLSAVRYESLNNSICCANNVLLMCNAFTRHSASSYPVAMDSRLSTFIPNLLKISSSVMRANAACLVGNLCKHSGMFLAPLARVDVPTILCAMVGDADNLIVKYSAFALGNATFQGAVWSSVVRSVIPTVSTLITSGNDPRTASNAAGNLMRHGTDAQLAEDIVRGGAITALMSCVLSPTLSKHASLLRVCLFSLGSLAPYTEAGGNKQFLKRLSQILTASNDEKVKSYAKRLRNALRQ